MKAIAVFPGKPNSVHLRQVPKPSLEAIPDGRGVLVKVLRVGLDGTDKEINAGEYGSPPPGEDFLITGRESFGIVEETGPAVTELAQGNYVVPTVRRPGGSLYDRIGMQDMTTDDVHLERGISLGHGFLAGYLVEAEESLVKVPSSVTGGGRSVEVPADRINLGFVLGNKVVVGTVNANRGHFEEGVRDLGQAELQWPVWLSKLLTHPVEGLDRYEEAMKLLGEGTDVVKVFVRVFERP